MVTLYSQSPSAHCHQLTVKCDQWQAASPTGPKTPSSLKPSNCTTLRWGEGSRSRRSGTLKCIELLFVILLMCNVLFIYLYLSLYSSLEPADVQFPLWYAVLCVQFLISFHSIIGVIALLLHTRKLLLVIPVTFLLLLIITYFFLNILMCIIYATCVLCVLFYPTHGAVLQLEP